MGIGTRGAIPSSIYIHQPGIDLDELLVADTRPLGGAGAHAVKEHIGLCHQLLHDLLAFGGLQVQAQPLVPGHGPVGPQPVLGAPGVVPFGWLDSDDPGAHLGDQGAAQRSGDDGAQVDDGDPLEGMGRHGPLFRPLHALAGAVQGRHHLGRVLARRGSRPLDGRGHVSQMNEGPQLAGPPECRVLNVGDETAVDHLDVVHALAGGHQGLGGHVSRLVDEGVHPLCQGPLLYPLQDDLPEGVPVLIHQDRRCLEPGVLVYTVQVQGMYHGVEEAPDDVGELDPFPIPGPCRHVAGGRLPTPDPWVFRELLRVRDHHLPQEPLPQVVRGHGPHQRGLHLLALARLVPHQEGRDGSPHQGHGGGVAPTWTAE